MALSLSCAIAVVATAQDSRAQSEELLTCIVASTSRDFRSQVAETILATSASADSEATIEKLSFHAKECADRFALSSPQAAAYFEYALAKIVRDWLNQELGKLGLSAYVVDAALGYGAGRRNPIISQAISREQSLAVARALSDAGVDVVGVPKGGWELVGLYIAATSNYWQAQTRLADAPQSPTLTSPLQPTSEESSIAALSPNESEIASASPSESAMATASESSALTSPLQSAQEESISSRESAVTTIASPSESAVTAPASSPSALASPLQSSSESSAIASVSSKESAVTAAAEVLFSIARADNVLLPMLFADLLILDSAQIGLVPLPFEPLDYDIEAMLTSAEIIKTSTADQRGNPDPREEQNP